MKEQKKSESIQTESASAEPKAIATPKESKEKKPSRSPKKVKESAPVVAKETVTKKTPKNSLAPVEKSEKAPDKEQKIPLPLSLFASKVSQLQESRMAVSTEIVHNNNRTIKKMMDIASMVDLVIIQVAASSIMLLWIDVQ